MALAKGHGTLLQLSIASVFTTVAQRVQVTPPNMERASIDKTNLDSAWFESLPGIPKGGDVELTCHYDPAASTHAQLWTSFQAGTTEAWKIVLTDPGAADISFSGWVKNMEIGEATTDELVELSITIEITGAVTITP